MAYNVLLPEHFLVAGDMSLSSITSSAIETKYQDNIGIQLNWTGTPTGTFDFQVSMDHSQDINGNIKVAGTWVSLPVNPIVAPAGGASSAYVDFNQLSTPYIRVVYTRTSGSGTLQGYTIAKGV